MGKVGQSIRLVTGRPTRRAGGSWQILCPFLEGLDPQVAFWIGGLAWHDANAKLLDCLSGGGFAGRRIFAGVFCTDPFRRDADIFAALRAAGVDGIVNLPTVSFFDGELATILDSFRLGIAHEIDFLHRARDAGFHIAACVPVGEHIRAMADAGAELIIVHNGPPPVRPDARASAAIARARRLLPARPPVIGASELLSTLA